MIIIAAETGFVEQTDQVDIRRVVQLERAHLAHCQRHQTATGLGIRLDSARQFAALDLGPDGGAQGKLARQIGKTRQRACHRFQQPDAAQISQRRQQRHAALALPQGNSQRIRGCLGHIVM